MRTAVGLVDLWEVPLKAGGTCTFTQADGRVPRKLRAPAPGPCAPRGLRQSPILWSPVHVAVGRSRVRMLAGHVLSGIDSLELRLGEGRERAVPLAGGYFLTPIAPSAPRPELVAGKDGLEVARTEVTLSVFGQSFGGAPELQPMLARARTVLEATAPAGPVFLVVDRRTGCATGFDGGGFTLPVCPGDRPAFTVAGGAGATLVAYAGRDAASLDFEFVDGSSRRLPLVDGWALYVFARDPDPKALVARRADGSVLERLPVPWF